MNDSEGKKASSLAIIEKKNQRVDGCKGIFFHLFDWKERLARKKLFSKKLLPGVHSKGSSKKFGGDDNQPKLHLIADENSGKIPNVTKVDPDKRNETRAPSLIAKLMGLETMPAMQKCKSRKGFNGNGSGRAEKFVNQCKKLEGKELILERADAKNEWWPQKFQKTGLPERSVAKLGVDQLQMKTVLSRSRNHQPPKLCSPVKSPRSSGKNASRLMDVATRILEPGLQKSRGRYALTYLSNSSCRSNYESMTDERIHSPPELLNSSNYYTSTAAIIPKRRTPCTNCGLPLDRFCSESTPERSSKNASLVSQSVDFCCEGYVTSQPRKMLSYPGLEDKKVESRFGSASQLNTSKGSYNSTSSRKPPNKEIQVKWQMNRQRCNSNTQMQNQVLQTKDWKPARSKLTSVQGDRVSGAASVIRETKSFAPLGQSYSGHTRDSEPRKMNDWKYESERNSGIRRKDATSFVQKKMPTNFHKKYESLGHSSDPSRQLRTGSEVYSEREARFKAVSVDSCQIESPLAKPGNQRRIGSGDKQANFMDSVTFKSSAKYISQSHSEIEYCAVQTNSSFENSCEDGQSIALPKPVSMSGDALSTLLEQKLQELTSQGDDDSAKGGNAPKKTTAMILQELITALTTEQHYHNHSVGQSNREQDPCYNQHCLSSADTSFRFKAQNASLPAPVRHENDDSQRLSTGSVLEASFSIESCSSSNQDDISIPQNKRVFESSSCFNTESTISQRQQITGEVENRLLNNVTDILCSISVTETSLVGSKLNHAKGVILDAELMLANEGFPIIQYLFTELETLASIIRMSFSYTRAWNQVKGFAFDSVIEYLDSRFSHYSKCGFSAWSRLPLHMDSEMVILEIIEEIRRWTQSAGMMPDDLIEWDMSHSLGKWTDFEVEAFETGVELDQYILETLIDELVIDLCTC